MQNLKGRFFCQLQPLAQDGWFQVGGRSLRAAAYISQATYPDKSAETAFNLIEASIPQPIQVSRDAGLPTA